jgi:hypothetical protein
MLLLPLSKPGTTPPPPRRKEDHQHKRKAIHTNVVQGQDQFPSSATNCHLEFLKTTSDFYPILVDALPRQLW